MADEKLPPFQIRNLESSNKHSSGQDALVRISGPTYDRTISDNPAATLRYMDEDNDTIILGSSDELIDKLQETVRQGKSSKTSKKNKERMSIAMLLSEAQQNPDSLQHHVFDIDEREEIQKLWQEIQQRNKILQAPVIPVERSQDHWKPAENPTALLRDEDLSWEEFTGKLEGHRTIDGALRCETTSTNEKNRDEVVTKLAVAYQRHRKDMWTPIAVEVGITWEEAESMHRALQDKTRLKTHELVTSEANPFESLRSTREIHDHRNESPPPPNLPSFAVPKSEDYRVHHFNLTKPPQLQRMRSVCQIPTTGTSEPRTTKPSLSPTNEAPVANLTLEGRRQAQAAGDVLRARNTTSRHRKLVITAADHTNLQNRWADYKSTDSAFSSKALKGMAHSFDKSALTSDGKRQAQAAGDKLRCRTNPIRHSRPLRSGSLEHGVSKNRWSSFVTPRAARFDDKYHAGAESIPKSQSVDAKAKDADKQATLLEVFEAELTKNSFSTTDAKNGDGFPDPEISAIPTTGNCSGASAESSNVPSADSTSSAQQPSSLLGGVQMICDHLQGLTVDHEEATRDFPQVIENCLRTAVGGFDALVQGLSGSLQEVSDRTHQAADKSCISDSQNIDGAIKGLRDLVVNLTTSFGEPGADENETKSKPSTGDDTVVSSTISRASGKAGDLCQRDSTSTADSAIAATSPQEKRTVAADASVKRGATTFNDNELGLLSASGESCLHQTQSELGSSAHRDGAIDIPRYHEPGPIHLPHYVASSRSTSTVNPRKQSIESINLNQCHQVQARHTGNVNEAGGSPTTSPYPAATRFPTLAQFEQGQDFASAAYFPPLPSMEPLVPQRVLNQVTNTSIDTKSQPTQDLLGARAQSGKVDSVIAATHLLMNNGINPGDLTDAQFTSFQQQLPDVQQKSVQLYAKNLANSFPHEQPSLESGASTPESRLPRNNGEEEYEMQLKLLEQQNKKRLLMSRFPQEQVGLKSGASTPESQRRSPRNAGKEDYEMQLRLLDQQNKKRLLMCRLPHEGSSRRFKLSGEFLSEDAHSAQSTAPSPTKAFEPHASRQVRPRSAARLVEPFNPLEVEPSAQRRTNEEIRRSATFAGTNNSNHAPRRRPYSEAYDGLGRVGWDSFLGDAHHTSQDSSARSDTDIDGSQTNARRQVKRDQSSANQDDLRRSGTVSNTRSRRSAPSYVRYDEVQQDDATAGAIEDCVDTLYSMGYADTEGEEDRLWVYAQASGGDLADAIDMIDEDQRVYSELC